MPVHRCVGPRGLPTPDAGVHMPVYMPKHTSNPHVCTQAYAIAEVAVAAARTACPALEITAARRRGRARVLWCYFWLLSGHADGEALLEFFGAREALSRHRRRHVYRAGMGMPVLQMACAQACVDTGAAAYARACMHARPCVRI